MQLEDEFGDIIEKAWSGLGLSIENVSSKTKIELGRLNGFLNYSVNPDESEIKKLSKLLNLNYTALSSIAIKKYFPKKFASGKFFDNIKIISVKGLLNNYAVFSYIIIDKNNNCVIIDTAGSPDLVINEIKKSSLKPLYILVTHSHYDHIGGINKIRNEFKIDGYIFKSKLFNSEKLISLEDRQIINFNGKKIKVIHTPGHTQDSCSFIVNNFLFCGDLIFAGSLGRANWSYKEILGSARKVLSYPKDFHIFPGHGPATTIAEELENNAFITKD